MPILTKPSEVYKGLPAVFTLTTADLAVLPSVSADDFFADSTNWKRVALIYKSTSGKQRVSVVFEINGNPTSDATFLSSLKARGAFEIDSIYIYDFDGDFYWVKKEELTVAEFDITFSV